MYNQNNTNNTKYIIFASNYDESEVNNYLDTYGIQHKKLHGSYVMENTGEKVVEPSWLVSVWDFDFLDHFADDQESILELGYNKGQGREAKLIFNKPVTKCGFLSFGKGDIVDLGTFKEISKEQAENEDYWTLCLATGKYFKAE